jgi:serine phosphatase RsbU (regulator of sigma subunit)
VAVIVADVVGHGVAAALMMAKLSAEAKFCLASGASPALAVTTLNDRLSNMQVDRFVTMIMLVLDPASHEITIVNAGHMAPLHLRQDGEVQEPGTDESGMPLGISEGLEYEQIKIKLEPAESLTLYTDGINEAMNQANVCFGIPRIRDHIVRAKGASKAVGEAVIRDVLSYIQPGPQEDDMCLVTMQRMS